MQEGPFVRSLDKALASFHVERQAYHGGSFIGNHVHRCLKVKKNENKRPLCYVTGFILCSTQPHNAHTLCSAPVALAQQMCTQLVPHAESVRDRFERAFLLFGECHTMYNKAGHVTH